MSLKKNLMENVLSICKEAIPYFYDEICHPNKILTVIAFISISLLLICCKSTANDVMISVNFYDVRHIFSCSTITFHVSCRLEKDTQSVKL